ncbi:MAG TPA: GFA family protein [Povalibacter sp.]
MDQSAFAGGCLCGAVRYRSAASPVRGVMCHCSMCRRHSGAPALAFVHFPATAFAWEREQVTWYRSSPHAERGFCAVCGSTVAMREDVLNDRVQICVGSLDEPGRVRIDDHVWTSEQISWFEVRDDLPRFARSSSAVPSKAESPGR